MEYKEYRNYFGCLNLFGIIYGGIILNTLINVINEFAYYL